MSLSAEAMDVRPDFVPHLLRWQRMVDLLTQLSGMPYAMINRRDGDQLVVQTLSTGLDLFQPDQRIDLQLNTYCARALRQGAALGVEDATRLPEMQDNPTAQAGLIAYYGLPIRQPDGQLFGTICMLDSVINQPGDQARELITMMRDSIEQDLALLLRNAELAGSEARALRAQQVADEANRAKSDFLARVNHELRTPLSAVLGFAQLLELDAGTPLSAQQQQRVQQIRGAGEHLLSLIDDMLDIASIEAGRLTLQMQRCDPSQQLHDAIALSRGAAETMQLRLPDVPASLPAVRADARRLHQVLLNVLSNAIKYNRPGGAIHLAVERTAQELRLRISDTGLGMSAEQLAQAFQPFNRLGRQHSGIAGTGLGLALSQQLMTLMGGRITLDSRPEQGTTVELALPLAD